jgi:hypothetical protein
MAMKLFVGGIMSAALIFGVAAADAQVLPPAAVDPAAEFDEPYAGMPPEAAPPSRYIAPEGLRHAPRLMPPREVYRVLRDNGFSPLGVPQQRGNVYTIAAINLESGDDGRLVIDARDGRILRFMPGYRIGDAMNRRRMVSYGPVGVLPPMGDVGRAPRPPLSIPRVAGRSPVVPLPKASPQVVAWPSPVAAKPATPPAQQSAAVQVSPPEVMASPTAGAAPVEAKPAGPQIKPTQEMPAVQGLE